MALMRLTNPFVCIFLDVVFGCGDFWLFFVVGGAFLAVFCSFVVQSRGLVYSWVWCGALWLGVRRFADAEGGL